MKGIISKEVDGKVRHFHFGTQMFVQLEDQGITLSNMQEKLQDRMFNTTIEILYNAATSYCRINRQDVDFEREDVAVWIDEIGINDSVNMITDGLKVLEKNPVALTADQG